MSRTKIPILTVGLATIGAASFAGFLILYWQKKKRQHAIERNLRGNRKQQNNGQTAQESLPKSASTAEEVAKSNEAKSKKNETVLENGKQDDETETGKDTDAKTTKRQERCITFEMTISREVVASLIGKGGAHIRMLQRDTKTRILPRGDVLENGDRIYTITGTPDAVSLAENKIRKLVMSLPVLTRIEIEVPEQLIGRIIGHRGENIRAIQDQSLARIEIPSDAPIEEKLFTDEDYESPKPVDRSLRKVIIKGTEEQIATAQKLINIEVEKDATLRARILDSVKNRSDRRNPKMPAATTSSSVSPPQGENHTNGVNVSQNANVVASPIPKDDQTLPNLRYDKTLDVFVSCVYHPNELYVQVANHESIKLDKLVEDMTQHYFRIFRQHDVSKFAVGDVVAAKYHNDNKIYRAKILTLNGNSAEIIYVDFGDKQWFNISQLRRLKPEFLQLRFQAVLATLNLECLDEKWTDEAISATAAITLCGTWKRMKAKILGYLKHTSDVNQDMIWLELYNENDNNIADTLIREGYAGLKVEQPTPPVAVAPIITKPNKGTSPFPSNGLGLNTSSGGSGDDAVANLIDI